MYLLNYQIFLSDYRTIIVQISKCIRPNYKMYMSWCRNIFFKISRKIVPISKIKLSSFQNPFVRIWKYLYKFQTVSVCPLGTPWVSWAGSSKCYKLWNSQYIWKAFWASSSGGSGHSELQGWPGVKQQSWVRAACCGETDCDQRALWSGG